MTDAQIRSFILVADAGSIKRAAEQLIVSPPALSKQLSTLERDLGTTLFVRSTNGLTLTPGGKILYEYFSRMMNNFPAALEAARNANDNERKAITIGCREDWNLSEFLPQCIESLQRVVPNLEVNVDIFRDEDLIMRLINGQLDLALMSDEYVRQHRNVTSERLTTISSGLLYSRHHPLAGKEGLCLEDFRNEPFLVINQNDKPDRQKRRVAKLRSRCQASHFEPTVVHASSMTAALCKVYANQGVVFVSEWSISRYNTELCYLPIDRDIVVDLCWASEKNIAVKKQFQYELSAFFSSQKEN